jgi:8-amino-7-oxononanoate synthase
MEYISRLLTAAEEQDVYPNGKSIEAVPYPELIIEGKKYLCLCSNNYLGLSIHPAVKKAAIEGVEKYGIGTCDSRLIAGNLKLLENLEKAIADFKRAPDAIVFATGFMANIGIISGVMDSLDIYDFPAIKNENNLIITDFLSHQSIFAGCRISRSPTKTYLHKDMCHLEKILKKNKDKRKLIITDGLFSMDGDLAPLPEILELAKLYHAMVLVDDAHATGIIGENGRGTPEHFGVEGKVDMVMGTFSKAVGALGGFLTGSPELIKVLKGRALSYIYSSSLPPEQACGIMAALKIIQKKPDLRAALWKNVRRLKSGLEEMGFDTMNCETQLIPIYIGEEAKARRAARLLFEKGILAPAILWPVVQHRKARIRVTAMATHTAAQIDRALEAFRDMGKELGVI